MKVLKVEPNMAPVAVEIENGLESLQREVDGYIEVIYPFDDSVGIVCNEDAKLCGLEYNRALRDDEGRIYDIIAGAFLVVGLTEDDFGSLTDEQVARYMELYATVESFINFGGRIVAIR